jgi:hypothetical protein
VGMILKPASEIDRSSHARGLPPGLSADRSVAHIHPEVERARATGATCGHTAP